VSALETRTVTMTEEQWRHLEMRAAEEVESSKADVEAYRFMGSNAVTAGFQADLDFNTAILTSLRSATA